MFDKVANTHPEHYAKDWRVMMVRLHHALSFLLQHELPRSKVSMKDDPMLHSATLLLHMEDSFDVIYSIIHTLVRYGYPTEEKGLHGLTPLERAYRREEYFEHEHPEFEAIVGLLSKPTQPLTLQELAARCVLQHRIPYSLATVPSTVYNFLRGNYFYPI